MACALPQALRIVHSVQVCELCCVHAARSTSELNRHGLMMSNRRVLLRSLAATQECELRAWMPGLQIPAPPQDERRKVMENVDQDRRHAIDAAIVRTMKSRKVLQHQQVQCLFLMPLSAA